VITHLPAKRQTLFFSATMPPEIQKLADTILHNPIKVAVTPVASTAEIIDQSVYFVEKKDKKALLIDMLNDRAIRSALVFARTKHGANKIVKDLVGAGIPAEAIHGNKSQNARQAALQGFKTGRLRVLVATDIAARGIDIDALSHVFNYELPNIPETYVHRIGRTGRAGASGVAISFCDSEERPYLRDIQKLIGKNIPVVTLHAYHSDGIAVSAPASASKGKSPQSGQKRFREDPSRSNTGFSPNGASRQSKNRFRSTTRSTTNTTTGKR
jgi:ATP-dependent RNA helicase RhlE